MPKPTRLLYLIGQYPAINHGYLLTEVRQLRALGFEVAVASISPPDRPIDNLSAEERDEVARAYYVKSEPIPKVVWLNLAEFLRHPLRYLRGFLFTLRLGGGSPRRVAYHLAYLLEAILVGRHMRVRGLSHVHANFSATVALILTNTFPVTMSFAVHGFGELHNPAESQLEERVKGAEFVRSISRHGRGQLMLSCDRSQWSKLIYVPLGIDPNEFAPRRASIGSQPFRILCVGRLAPEKGQGILLEGIAALRAADRLVHLSLVGDGPDRAWLERRAADLGISSNVSFVGWVGKEKLIPLYAETDLFALPSLAEGIPIVLMEAMAMQIPCVAPHITGIPELIEHGVNGMLFTVADVQDLSEQIETLMDSPELRLRIGEQARLRVAREYDMARNTERFASILRERLNGLE